MISVSVKVNGFDRIMQNLNHMKDNVVRKTDEGIVQAVDLVESTMRNKTPIKTGKLAGGYRRFTRPLFGKIENNVGYAHFVDHGTRPHKIPKSPKEGKFLVFSMGGKTMFIPQSVGVNHPGTKGQKQFSGSITNTRRAVQIIMQRKFQEVLR